MKECKRCGMTHDEPADDCLLCQGEQEMTEIERMLENMRLGRPLEV